MEELALGASHADKVGKVVTVDVDAKDGRYLVTGVLHSARDTYSVGDQVKATTLVIGLGAVVELDWENDGTLTAQIEKH